MSELNVEKIMEEIREEIKEKGYTNDMLSFSDMIVYEKGGDVEKFERVKFSEELFNLNMLWNVNPVRPIEKKPGIKGKLICLYRKIVRRCIRSYISPIVWEQDTFNATTVRLFNLVNFYMEENMRLLEELNRVKESQDMLEKRVNQLYNLHYKEG